MSSRLEDDPEEWHKSGMITDRQLAECRAMEAWAKDGEAWERRAARAAKVIVGTLLVAAIIWWIKS